MELNKTCLEILKVLRDSDDFVKINTLSGKYNVSDRSILYNITKIEEFLHKNGFDYLERHHLKGVKLTKNPKVVSFIGSFIGKYTPYKYFYTKEERFQFITTKLIQENKAIKLEYFEKKLCVSKNTILREIAQIEKWLNERELLLIRKSRVGFIVEGSEILKRKAIIELASETIFSEDIINYINTKQTLSKISNLQFDTLFSDIDIDYLDNLIRNVEIELQRKFSDVAYGNLITHLAIMIKRLQLGKKIFIPDDMEFNNIVESKEYNTTSKIIEKLGKHYSINIPLEEIKYIALHLLGAKIIKNNEGIDTKNQEIDPLYKVAKTMTEEIENIYGISFGDKEQKIIEGLMLHLRPTIYRIEFNLKLINPLLNDIYFNYIELFKNTKLVMRHFEQYIRKKVDDHEIAYVTLHFGAALENVKRNLKKIPKIVIVCGTGIGTAKMLATKISNEFTVRIIDTISAREIMNYKTKNIDYIISTVDIPSLDKNSYIKVNAFLLKDDYDILKKFLTSKNIYTKQNGALLNKVNEIVNIVEKYCDIKDREQLQYEIMYKLESSEGGHERRYVYMINDLITSNVIKLNVECKNWIQAIEIGAELLLKKGCILESYKDAILHNFKELGPYMVVAPGIVLSHARPECGVKKLSISLITLKEPVKFGNETNDPVKLVITLAATDNESHLKALSQLMNLFMNAEDLNKVMNSQKKEEVLSILNNYSKD